MGTQNPITTKDAILETGASSTQNFEPIKAVCAHLNAFHVYADDLIGRGPVEANHYCAHLNEDVRQCLIYDAPGRNARLIGMEYLITKKVFDTLDLEEKKLWHSHDYEVRSGMLIMPNSNVPAIAWDKAETEEMKELLGTYGKTFGTWQVDRGDKVPLGMPVLMGSYLSDDQVPWDKVKDRDERFGVDTMKKREQREGHLPEPNISEDADSWWKEKR